MNRRTDGFSRLPLEEGEIQVDWQRGLGVVSFGKRQLPWVLDYIAKQKEHHAQGTTKRRLEQIGYDDDGKPFASA